MARTVCAPGQWTSIPDTGGSMLLEARHKGVYVDTSGAQPGDPEEGYVLADGDDMVISPGLTVSVWPITDTIETIVYSHII